MLFSLWRWIQLWLPFGLILAIYKSKKALPANIKTRQGRDLKAIMITTEYGVLFSEEKYISERTKKLKQQKDYLDKAANQIVEEINSLNFMEREKLYGHLSEQE